MHFAAHVDVIHGLSGACESTEAPVPVELQRVAAGGAVHHQAQGYGPPLPSVKVEIGVCSLPKHRAVTTIVVGNRLGVEVRLNYLI